MVAIHGLVATVYFSLFCLIFHVMFKWASSAMAPVKSAADGGRMGFVLGVILGAFGGCFFVQGGSSLMQMLTVVHGQRTDRLMLQYHDALQDKKETPESN